MKALFDNNTDWVSLIANDDDDTRFCYVLQTVNGNWLSNLKPANFHFKARQ